jgi:hypothetical protein
MVRSLDSRPSRLFLIGCEPAILEADDIALSEAVVKAVPLAIEKVHELVDSLLREPTSEAAMPAASKPM